MVLTLVIVASQSNTVKYCGIGLNSRNFAFLPKGRLVQKTSVHLTWKMWDVIAIVCSLLASIAATQMT